MPITVNHNGVLRTLNVITVNHNGVLRPLKTVYANHNGVLREIYNSGLKLEWKSNDSDYTILSTTNDGKTLKFRSTKPNNSYTYSPSNTLYCQLILSSTTTVNFSIENIDNYENKQIAIYNNSSPVRVFENGSLTLSAGTYYIYPAGNPDLYYDDYADFIVTISIS